MRSITTLAHLANSEDLIDLTQGIGFPVTSHGTIDHLINIIFCTGALYWVFFVAPLLVIPLLWTFCVVHLLMTHLHCFFTMPLLERLRPLTIGQAIHPTGVQLVGISICLMNQTLSCHEVKPTTFAMHRCHSSKADC